MPLPFPDSHARSFLAAYRPPRPAFTSAAPPALEAVWAALAAGQARAALDAGLGLLRGGDLAAEPRAALLAAVAAAYAHQGQLERARATAEASREAWPAQWLAQRVLLDVLLAEQSYPGAFALATAFTPVEAPAAWDEPLPPREQHLAAAATAWLVGAWDAAAAHLTRAFPGGLDDMPAALQEDWFRLAFYRAAPDDAAAAAGLLIAGRPTESADVLLQALVKQGWNRQALALYRALFDREPGSELLRRRLVGLCIREGDVVGARRLMEQGALKLTAS